MTTMANITCPKCGRENDAHSSPEDDSLTPDSDDLSVCLQCGHLSAYVKAEDGTLSIRPLTEEEYVRFMEDPDIRRLLALREEVMNRDRPAEAP
jgi:hypothetical protein